MEITVISILAGVSAGLFLWSLAAMHSGRNRSTPEARFMTEPAPILLRMLLPPAAPLARSLSTHAGNLRACGTSDSSFLKFRDHIGRSLITAGIPGGITPDELIAISAVSGFLSALFGGLLAAGTGRPPVLFGFALGVLGLFLPYLWLNDRMKRRHLAIRKALPYTLDLLTLCVEAGLDFTTALARIVPKLASSPLGYELGSLLRELQMGKPRAEGLRDLAWRVNLIEVTTVANSIIQADELGTSIGPTLRIQAEEARRRRSVRAEELAMKAPVKLLFPLVAFIFPTTFIILFGPIFIKNLPLLEKLSK